MVKPLRVAVVGSRTFKLKGLLVYYLDNYFWSVRYKIIIVSGGAKGADSFAEEWADERKVKTKIYKAKWQKYGKRAGFVRNEKIVKNCDVVVAFWDGESKGTKHTIDLARKIGLKVYVVMFPGE